VFGDLLIHSALQYNYKNEYINQNNYNFLFVCHYIYVLKTKKNTMKMAVAIVVSSSKAIL